MMTTLALLAMIGAEPASTPRPAAEPVSVAVPEGVLGPQLPAAPRKGPPAPQVGPAPETDGFDRFRADADGPGVLVGNAAWYAVKFSADPILSSDHGEPMVRFEPSGPALPR